MPNAQKAVWQNGGLTMYYQHWCIAKHQFQLDVHYSAFVFIFGMISLLSIGYELKNRNSTPAQSRYRQQPFTVTFNYKHIGLIIGVITVIFSFLFFGRQQDTYDIILLVGILVSTIFFLAILFGKETLKSKLIWTAFVGISILFQRATEPTLINASYRIYINQHIDNLNAVNEILTKNSGDISVYADKVIDKNNSLSKTNKEELLKLREKLDTYIITKNDKQIYYGLWGFLDVRIGLTYFPSQPTKTETLTRVKENWYR